MAEVRSVPFLPPGRKWDMVAIFTGPGSGFDRGSGAVLGGKGMVGQAGLGQAGGTIAVNAASGTLTLSRADEILIGRGPDQDLGLNYSSTPSAWMQNWAWHGVSSLTGTVNTAGSTVK